MRVRKAIYNRLRHKGAETVEAGTHSAAEARNGDAAAGAGGSGAGHDPDNQDENESRFFPCIQGNMRQLPDITVDALNALRAANEPPKLFQRGTALTRLRAQPDTGAPFLETLSESALRVLMARVASWTRCFITNRGEMSEEAPPPLDVVKDLNSLPEWEGILLIESVTESPIFDSRGALVTSPGYRAHARVWYSPATNLTIPAVSESPSEEDIERARNLLLIELFGDFPFQDETSKTHALAAFLLSFARRMIDGPTPLHLFDAPVEGTGKTLLVSCITVATTGREPEGFTESASDDEWRKRLTAALDEGGTFLFLDNLNRILDSAALASVLTARIWKDRKLGVTKMLTLPNTAVWLASGNNTRLSRELIRRTVFCRLDAKVDAPWERTGFRHPSLLRWARDNRGQLVWAALTLVQAWIAAGRPAGTQTMGMFESWAEVIGGILGVAGMPGLLANAKKFRQTSADKAAEWRAFVATWWQTHADKAVGIRELFTLATTQQLLDSVLGEGGERSQRTRLGIAMTKMVDRVFGAFRIESAGEDNSARQLYRLVQVTAQPEPDKPVHTPPGGEDGKSETDVCEWSA
jgi:hypothetical protein